jgi:gluconolactonase
MTTLARSTLTFSLTACLSLACGAPESPGSSEEFETVALENPSAGTILRIDPRFDTLVPLDASIEQLASGFVFTEGPVWIRNESRLLFSDVRANGIYQWAEGEGTRPYLEPVFEGDRTGLRSISSNGLTLDAEGRLILCEHGNRRISRLESDGTRTILVSSYEGKRLNSPNDATYSSDGWLYFTDPSYGMEGLEDSPLRELNFNGIYRLSPSGDLELLYRDQSRPNGIALSPDERTLYVANSDENQKVWMAYDLDVDGVSNPRVFYDVNDQTDQGAADGMKVDRAGNIFATGPGGVWVFAADGTHLGSIIPNEVPANVAWGDDGHTLYMTAETGLYRIRLTTGGSIPGP